LDHWHFMVIALAHRFGDEALPGAVQRGLADRVAGLLRTWFGGPVNSVC
jgi:hypothetical protein